MASDEETLSRLASQVDCGVKASFGSEELRTKATKFLSDAEILKRTQGYCLGLGGLRSSSITI